MKISIYALVLGFLLFTIKLPAQFSLGVRGGHFTADQSYDLDGLEIKTEPIYGPDVALISEIGLAGSLFLQPEVHYLQKGAHFPNDDTGPIFEPRTNRFHQLDFLALLKLRTRGERFRLHLLAGPFAGYVLDGKTNTDASSDEIDLKENDFQRMEAGAVFGGGFGVSIRKMTVFVDGRYHLGISDNNTSNQNIVNVTSRNFGYSLGMGLMWSLSAK